ncbi:MAG: TetR/AcrR family transcriptional regulator [Alphaproteobacteria bacterium]|nr:TetR/AcrR family transcriptional regulator [Alphaproteobacteria bacterium]
MGKRAKAADETRRRIVEATYDLHMAHGIAATTMKQIAERADVGLGTVYHHFPSYDDIVRACGAHTFDMASPPTMAIFAGLASVRDRLARLVQELFAFYERCPGIARARADRDRIRALQEAMDDWEHVYGALIHEALRPGRPARRTEMALEALLDFDVHGRLVKAGLGTSQAAALITDVVGAWLDQDAQRQVPGNHPATKGKRP